MIRNKRGITLIALIITIIVLLILAGVTINMVLGDNGLINKAKNSSYISERGKLQEQLEIIKAELAIDNRGKKVTVKQYIERLQEDGITAQEYESDETNSEELETEIVTNNGYRVKITQENDNVRIEILEKDEGIAKRAVKIKGELKCIPSTDSIQVKVQINGAIGVTYIYHYKEIGGEEKTSEAKKNKHTITGLKENTQYEIWVEAYNENNEEHANSTKVTVKTVHIPDVVITLNPSGTVEVNTVLTATLSTEENTENIVKYKWKYNKNGENIGLDESLYTDGETASLPKDVTLSTNEIGEYYLHVLTLDNSGHAKENKTGPITVKPISLAGKVTWGTITWSGTNASMTATANITIPEGYKMQYKIETGEWTDMTNGGGISPIPQQTEVKVRISTLDESVGGEEATKSIGKVPVSPTTMASAKATYQGKHVKYTAGPAGNKISNWQIFNIIGTGNNAQIILISGVGINSGNRWTAYLISKGFNVEDNSYTGTAGQVATALNDSYWKTNYSDDNYSVQKAYGAPSTDEINAAIQTSSAWSINRYEVSRTRVANNDSRLKTYDTNNSQWNSGSQPNNTYPMRPVIYLNAGQSIEIID